MRVGLTAMAILVSLGAGAGAASARSAVGYVSGTKTKVKLTAVNGAELEVRTAAAFRAMAKAARKRGVKLAINSGFRSHAQQVRLYRDYRRGAGNLAARPGYSNHQSGRALDIYITNKKTLAWLKTHAAAYGFHRTVPGEAWHWEYDGSVERDARVRPTRHRRNRRNS